MKWYEVLGAAPRLRILDLLYDGQRTITELCKLGKMNHKRCDNHLQVLIGAGLVTESRHGTIRMFSIATEHDYSFSFARFIEEFRKIWPP